MDSPWAIPRAKLGWFGNDEKASCVTVSRRRSILPLPPSLSSPCPPRPAATSFPFVAVYRRTWGLALSILILLFHSASSVFRASSSSFFPVFFPLSLLDDLIVRSARESSISLFPPLRKPPSPPFPVPGTDLSAPRVTGTLHLPEHHHLRINRVWKINASRGDLRGRERRQCGWDNGGKGKKKGKMVSKRRSRCLVSTRYGEFFAADTIPCWNRSARRCFREIVLQDEVMNRIDWKDLHNTRREGRRVRIVAKN